jgi:ABC-type protease/lipase transport system fused ATPase/permease subunit
MFFLNNYKGITHTATLLIFIAVTYLIDSSLLMSPIYGLILLVSCFLITNFSIKSVGLDKAVQDELDKMAKEKSDK